jgi:6,7-dimethyl-8-ribityllumazine synthase
MVIEGKVIYRSVDDRKIGIVASRFNEVMVVSLIEGAQNELHRHGVDPQKIDIVRVPGAYEIPFMAQQLAMSKRYEGLITLGVVIRGETTHFDLVSTNMATGIMRVSCEHNIPVGWGVLAVENMEQALARSGSKSGNEGRHAAQVLLELLDLQRLVHGH